MFRGYYPINNQDGRLSSYRPPNYGCRVSMAKINRSPENRLKQGVFCVMSDCLPVYDLSEESFYEGLEYGDNFAALHDEDR